MWYTIPISQAVFLHRTGQIHLLRERIKFHEAPNPAGNRVYYHNIGAYVIDLSGFQPSEYISDEGLP